MKTKSLFFALIIIFLSACSSTKDLTQDQEKENLSNSFQKITSLANSENCVDASTWSFTAYGSKACGGPQGYIAYSNNINTTQFLALVEQYTQDEKSYNQKWGIISDCSIPQEPTSVNCEDDEAVFVY